MPVEQRLGLAGDGGVALGQHKGRRPHVEEFAAVKHRRGLLLAQVDGEQSRAAIQPQEDDGGPLPLRAPGQEGGPAALQPRPRRRAKNQGLHLPERQEAPRSAPGGEPGFAGALRAGPVKRISGKSDGGHAQGFAFFGGRGYIPARKPVDATLVNLVRTGR